jgi:hypothetical protein
MDDTKKQPTLMELSVAIAPLTHITQVRLLKSSIEAKAITTDAPIRLQHSFDALTELDKEANNLSVRASLEIAAGDVLHISAEFVLDYRISESPVEITDEAADAFGKMNGIHNIWPYWREYVQSVSVRAGLPPLVVPLVTGASLVAYYKARCALSKTHESTEAAAMQSEGAVA